MDELPNITTALVIQSWICIQCDTKKQCLILRSMHRYMHGACKDCIDKAFVGDNDKYLLEKLKKENEDLKRQLEGYEP